ncbi:MAG: hypothetical protein ABI742_04920 [Gemmatimonadota bacterium]
MTPRSLSYLLLALVACDGASGPGDSFKGLDAATATIAVGDTHNCLLDPSGAAVCWGKGTDGELGADSTPDIAGPAPVSGGHVFSALAVGRYHSCGLTPQGAAWCWGSDRDGQLGAGAAPAGSCAGDPCATAPIPVALNLSFTDLLASGSETCGLTADSTAWCWGLNDFGQLGATVVGTCPDGPCSRDPVAVSGGHHFARLSVSGAGHACGLHADGQAWCWGLNHQGQLGADSVVDYVEQPLRVAGGLRFRQLSAGGLHTCGLTGDGTAWCWGIDVLPLKNTGDLSYYVPNKVATPLRFAAIESGRVSECALTSDGAPYCWGANAAGEIGTTPIGSTYRFDAPVAVGGGLQLLELRGEMQTYCGRAATGAVYCWGQGTSGQLGAGSVNSPVPLMVPGT